MTKRDASGNMARRLIGIARELALELHPRLKRGLSVGLDSDLDKDLGLDSLGRAEFLLRLDQAFKVKLPEQLVADAVIVNDLLEAIEAAGPGRAGTARLSIVEHAGFKRDFEPIGAKTLPDVLNAHVAAHADRTHIWLWQSEGEEQKISYGELDGQARRIAGALMGLGIEPGERVAIMLPSEAGFFHAFFGILYAGGVPVPIYPPFRRAQVEDHLRRQAGILRNAQASLLITDKQIRNVGMFLYGLVPSLKGVETVEKLSAHAPTNKPIAASADATALIQYTSGSTGDPKGVVLSHANLIANIRAMGEAMGANAGDVLVSWLPLYHDMGLIGAWLGCLYFGAASVIMPPLGFLADPARWLWTMHRHRATLSAAPNFAFELCVKNVRDEDIEGLDLSSLRMVVNGAEPVNMGTIDRFTERFARYGFKPEALAPVYGLAECSVGLAFPPLGRKPIIDRVNRKALTQGGRATPAARDEADALEFVACGQPLPGHQVRIVDASGREVPERHEGRLEFKGPSATSGYFRDPEKTRALINGDWLDTGDTAYVARGDIYITGRIKDIIIKAGRNIYPQELEELVGNIEDVRKGCVAAFAGADARTGSERLIVMAETYVTDPGRRERLRTAIADASLDALDLPLDDVVLVKPHSVPKTSSGKIRRSAARTFYEGGLAQGHSRALWWQLVRLGASGGVIRARRAAQRMSHLAYGAYWWMVLAGIGALAWPLVVLLPGGRARHFVVHWCARAFFALTGIGITVETEAAVRDAGVVLAANHSSYLDGAVLKAVIPGQIAFVVKHELASQIVAGPFLRRLGALFVRRKDAAGGIEDTAGALDAARAGRPLLFFPEATFTRMPGLLPFRLGAFQVAARAGIAVVPITIWGTRSILRADQWLPRRGRINVHIGQPVEPVGADFEAVVGLRDAVRAQILETCKEPDLAHERVTMPGA